MKLRFSHALLLATALAAPPLRAANDKDAGDLLRRLAAGEPAAGASLESRLAPLFERKDLFGLGEETVAQEVRRALGGGTAPAAAVLWRALTSGATNARLLTVEVPRTAAPTEPGPGVWVSYAIVEEASHASSKAPTAAVAWYHDPGRHLEEQGGEAWHPVAATLLGGSGGAAGGPTIAVLEAAKSAGEARGVLLFEPAPGGGWTAARRIAAPAGLQDARLIGVGEGGVVLTARREPPKGMISGAPPDLFHALVLFERRSGKILAEPVVSALPDPVSAAEALLAALRRDDREGALRLCRSKDVLESLLYFSPSWKGGGRVVSATDRKLEMVYEEQGRPSLRLELAFVTPGGGGLLLDSATGRLEQGARP